MITFRKINQGYLKDIVDIEQECFMSPWSEEQLLSELSNNPFSISLRMFRTIKMPIKAITAVEI